jgi:nucleotide-binding universal stress UspA family protein
MMDVKFGLVSPEEKVDEKIKMFERASITGELKLRAPSIERIFLAIDSHLDASEISENAIQITVALAMRFRAEVYIACIAPSSEELKVSERLTNESVERLESLNVSVIGGCTIGRPSEHILELSKHFNPSLIVMPIPYGERSETFDIESLGATVDLIIRKSPFPILFVRKPIYKPKDIAKNILVIIDKLQHLRGAEVALTLGERGSTIKLLSITEKEKVETAKVLAQTIVDSEIGAGVLENAHKLEIQPLISVMNDEAKTRGINLERIHHVGNRVKMILNELKYKHTIIVASTSLIGGNILDSEVENLVRFSKIPVLIVKT